MDGSTNNNQHPHIDFARTRIIRFFLFFFLFFFACSKNFLHGTSTHIHTHTHQNISSGACMLMEIVCFYRMERDWARVTKEDIGLNLHQSISKQTLHSCIQCEVRHGKSITCKLFSCRFMWAKFKFGLSARPANTKRSS